MQFFLTNVCATICCWRSGDLQTLVGYFARTVAQRRRLRYNKPMKNTKHIIFDLDGTLLDSKRCFEVSLVEAYGRDCQECYQCFGLSETHIVEKLGIPTEQRTAFVQKWHQCALGQPCYLFDGVEDMLKQLKARNYQLAVISSRSVASLSWTLDKMGILHYFNNVYGEELASQPKPSPLPMLAYMQKHGVDTSDVFYVGDLPTDMQCAVGAGVGFAFAGWNKSVKPVNESLCFATTTQLVQYLDALFLDLGEKGFVEKLTKGMDYFRQKVALLNKLNYFPVPDDDTGSNMEHTLQTALFAHTQNPSANFANTLLASARGNSGMILASAICGFLQEIQLSHNIGKALDAMCKQAYKSVLHPREGTMLTFFKQLSAGFCNEMMADVDSFKTLMKTALLSTQTELTAGRIDSGALGVFFLVEALLGLTVEVEIDADFDNKQIDLEFCYCTELTLQPNADFVADSFVEEILPLGNSINRVFVGDVFKLHIHTNTPCQVFRLASKHGNLLYTKIDNMELENQPQGNFANVCVLDFSKGHEVFPHLAVEYVTSCTLDASLADKVERLNCPTLVFCQHGVPISLPNGAFLVRTNGIVSALCGLLVAVEANNVQTALFNSQIASNCVEECSQNYTLAICGKQHVPAEGVARFNVETDKIFGGRVKQ